MSLVSGSMRFMERGSRSTNTSTCALARTTRESSHGSPTAIDSAFISNPFPRCHGVCSTFLSGSHRPQQAKNIILCTQHVHDDAALGKANQQELLRLGVLVFPALF